MSDEPSKVTLITRLLGLASGASAIKFYWILGSLLVGALASWGALAWHKHQITTLQEKAYAAGQAEVTERWQRANTNATKVQATQNENATNGFEDKKSKAEIRYVTKIEEVTRYVPNPSTPCLADPDFVRRFNAAGQ